jgi:rod shape-determining protein MreC
VQYLNLDKKRANYSIKHSFRLVLGKIETVLFIVICVMCIATSNSNKDFSKKVSEFFINISLPVANLLSHPVNSVFSLTSGLSDLIAAKKENVELKKQIDELKSHYIKSLNIYEENEELRKTLSFVSSKSTNFKVVEVIGRSKPLFDQKIFVSAGADRDLKEGEIVTGKIGVIGRVLEVFENKSHILLLNDATSRIPVISSKTRDRGVLVGDGTGLMEIIYLPKNHSIKVGEMIFTSGDGDTLPSGLLAGVVRKVGKDSVLVSMVEDVNNADLVTVLSF